MLATVKNFFTVALLLSAAAMAQAPLPDAPSAVKQQNVWTAPVKHLSFYVGVGVFTASAIADIHSTTACEHSVPRACFEAYPGHDRYIYALPLVLMVAAATYGCELMLTGHKYLQWIICPSIGIALSIQHWIDSRTIYHEDGIARP